MLLQLPRKGILEKPKEQELRLRETMNNWKRELEDSRLKPERLELLTTLLILGMTQLLPLVDLMESLRIFLKIYLLGRLDQR
jgi:hypothetical protein